MGPRDRWIAALLALAGIGLCLAALLTFLATIINNDLPWHRGQSAQEHYIAVGRAYSQGFSVGFFSCFFLALLALAFGSWLRARRALAEAWAEDGEPDGERQAVTPAPGPGPGPAR